MLQKAVPLYQKLTSSKLLPAYRARHAINILINSVSVLIISKIRLAQPPICTRLNEKMEMNVGNHRAISFRKATTSQRQSACQIRKAWKTTPTTKKPAWASIELDCC
jgi:hypothetical protein